MAVERHSDLVNLTGHDVRLTDGERVVIVESTLPRARVKSRYSLAGVVQLNDMEVPLYRVDEEVVVDVPGPRKGTLYIVSGLVASRTRRKDVVIPSRKSYDGSGVYSARALLGMDEREEER